MPSIKETLVRFFTQKPPVERSVPKDVNIQFHDLQDSEEAKKWRVSPGIFLFVSPIFPADMKTDKVFQALYPAFGTTIRKSVSLEHSNTQIFLDTTGQTSGDPSQLWRFTPERYLRLDKLFIVRAEHLSLDEALMWSQNELRIKGATILPGIPTVNPST